MWRDPVIEAYEAGVDRTLLRENLGRTVEQRFLRLMDLSAVRRRAASVGSARAQIPPGCAVADLGSLLVALVDAGVEFIVVGVLQRPRTVALG